MEAKENVTTKERLIEFIHNLTDQECDFIISSLYNLEKEKEQV